MRMRKIRRFMPLDFTPRRIIRQVCGMLNFHCCAHWEPLFQPAGTFSGRGAKSEGFIVRKRRENENENEERERFYSLKRLARWVWPASTGTLRWRNAPLGATSCTA